MEINHASNYESNGMLLGKINDNLLVKAIFQETKLPHLYALELLDTQIISFSIPASQQKKPLIMLNILFNKLKSNPTILLSRTIFRTPKIPKKKKKQREREQNSKARYKLSSGLLLYIFPSYTQIYIGVLIINHRYQQILTMLGTT